MRAVQFLWDAEHSHRLPRSVTVGNLWVLVANAGVQNSAVTKFIASTGFRVTAFQMFFFAVVAFTAALAFGLVARTYPLVDHYRRQ